MYPSCKVLAVLLVVVVGVSIGERLGVDGVDRRPPPPVDVARRFVRYAMASYCDDIEIVDWNCHACVDASTRNFQTKSTLFDPRSFTSAFVGVQPESSEIIVAFRGTVSSSVENWSADLDFKKTDLAYKADGVTYIPDDVFPPLHVHEGFLTDFLMHIKALNETVLDLQEQYPNYTISITGHSLGAAMATLGCLMFQLGTEYRSEGLRCITFGSPRVGDQEFAAYFDSMILDSWRYTHHNDPIVHLPPESFHFRHVNTEVYSQKGTRTRPCYAEPGKENNLCANIRFGFNAKDHLIYLGIARKGSCVVSKIHADNIGAIR